MHRQALLVDLACPLNFVSIPSIVNPQSVYYFTQMSFLSLQQPYFIYVVPQLVMPIMHVPQVQPKATIEEPQPGSVMPLDETTKQLQQFRLRLGSKAHQPVDEDRIEVGKRGNERLFGSFPSFEDIYAFTIERLTRSLTAGIGKTTSQSRRNLRGASTTYNYSSGFSTNGVYSTVYSPRILTTKTGTR